MIHSKEEEKTPETVTIAFGMMFKVFEFGKETENVDVIIDIGEDDYFYTCRIKKSKSGKPMLVFVHVGTAGSKQLGTIVGQLSLSQVIEYFKESIHNNWPPTPKVKAILKGYSRKKQRVINKE